MTTIPNHDVDVSWATCIARAKGLDPDALEAIVDQYASRLYGFFHRMMGVSDGVDDMVQEVFVRVVRMIPHYEESGRFESWLFRIAANLNRDRLRNLQRHPVLSLDEVNEAHSENEVAARLVFRPDNHSSPQSRMDVAEQLYKMQQCLMELSTEERTVILLRHYGQLEFSEIAELMETPVGTSLARSHRGLKKLRQMMESSR